MGCNAVVKITIITKKIINERVEAIILFHTPTLGRLLSR
jgi:hypothetical protein